MTARYARHEAPSRVVRTGSAGTRTNAVLPVDRRDEPPVPRVKEAADFAVAYADRTEEGRAAPVAAVRAGRTAAELGV